MDQRTPLQVLLQDLNTSTPETLLPISKQLVESITANPPLTLIHAILLIKNDQQSEAIKILQQLSRELKSTPQLLPPELSYTILYAHYKDGAYNQVINELKDKKNKSPQDKLLLAQTLAKNESYHDMIELYQTLLADNLFPEDASDIVTNIINGAILSNDQDLMSKINKLVTDYLKKQKPQFQTRELLLNYSLLSLNQHKFQNLIKLDIAESELNKDEDYLLSQFILDFIHIQQNQDQIKPYISRYEALLTQSLPSNLQPICLNNLAVLQEFDYNNHGETIKRIEEAQSVANYKYTTQQSNILKFNKSIAQLSRNRLPESIKNLKEIESALANLYPQEFNYIKQIQNVKQNQKHQEIKDLRGFLLVAGSFPEDSKRVLELFQSVALKDWSQNRQLILFILAHLLNVPKESQFDFIIQEVKKSSHVRELCRYYLKKGRLEEAIQVYDICEKQKQNTEDLKGQIALLLIDQGQWAQAEKFVNNIQYPFKVIDDLQQLEMFEKNVALSKMQRSKSGDLVEIEKKIKKKKRKRVRYPKGFDATNPGPLPNPERWVPKYDRKDFRKKKGGQMKSRTQGQTVGKETTNVFSQGVSSANVDVSTKNQKKNKKRK